MEKKLIKAPIDEKNITSDWIQDVFDNFNCVQCGEKYAGFINGVPAWCEIHDNFISWELCGDEGIERAFGILKYRLAQFDNENPDDIVVKYVDHNYGGENDPLCGTTQYFYFVVD